MKYNSNAEQTSQCCNIIFAALMKLYVAPNSAAAKLFVCLIYVMFFELGLNLENGIQITLNREWTVIITCFFFSFVLTSQSALHSKSHSPSHTHTFIQRSNINALHTLSAQRSGAVWVECLASHFGIQTGGFGDRTNDVLVSGWPYLIILYFDLQC